MFPHLSTFQFHFGSKLQFVCAFFGEEVSFFFFLSFCFFVCLGFFSH